MASVALAFAPETLAQEFPTQQHQSLLEEALSFLNLTLDDLRFPRLYFQMDHEIPSVQESIADPLAGGQRWTALARASERGPVSAWVKRSVTQGLGWPSHSLDELVLTPLENDYDFELPSVIPSLATSVRLANSRITQALANLSASERRVLIEGLPHLASEFSEVSFDFSPRPIAERATLLALLARVDVQTIVAAGIELQEAVEQALPALRATGFSPEEKLRLNINGVLTVIGTRGADLHDDMDALLTIDFGGNDTYTGRHGAGVGYASVLIDLGGNNQFEVGDLSVGASILGVGIAHVEGGHDRFVGQSLTFGATLAGFGSLTRIGGHDRYRSRALSQGFAMFGIGLLWDTAGDDLFEVGVWGQGAARTQGFGALVSHSGNDTFRAGGLVVHEPLFEFATYGMAQGFAMGYREEDGGIAGGIGMLINHGGHDTYEGGTFVQGASYWGSVGVLFDAQGHDRYHAHHYAQGSAMHQTAAFFFDFGGEDTLTAQVGAAHGIGHDYGMALAVLQGGTNLVASRDSAPGTGTANGLGIFLGLEGTTRYPGVPGRGNPARGTASLGVFADQGFPSFYGEGMQDGHAVIRPSYGIAYDVPTALTAVSEDTVAPANPGSRPRPSDSELESLFQQATAWGVGTAEVSVRQANLQLLEIGAPALEWMLETHLASADRFTMRAFVSLIRGLGEEAEPPLGRVALNARGPVLGQLLRLGIDANVASLGAVVPRALEDPELSHIAIRAAGALRVEAAESRLQTFLLNEDPFLSRLAMIALRDISNPVSIPTAQAMLGSDDFMVREAAMELIASDPEQGFLIAQSLINEPRETRARMGIRILSMIGSEEALLLAGSKLRDTSEAIRLEALRAMDGQTPRSLRGEVLIARDDPSPRVRALAMRTRIIAPSWENPS